MVYIVIALSFALAGGFVGRLKGSSFWIWFLISGVVPFIGLAAALLYRYDSDEPQRRCPTCGHLCMVHDALCTRCGTELEFPDESEILPPVQPA
jgi:DNA-directed RNA polymerase subunit RPC12/RpoP